MNNRMVFGMKVERYRAILKKRWLAVKSYSKVISIIISKIMVIRRRTIEKRRNDKDFSAGLRDIFMGKMLERDFSSCFGLTVSFIER